MEASDAVESTGALVSEQTATPKGGEVVTVSFSVTVSEATNGVSVSEHVIESISEHTPALAPSAPAIEEKKKRRFYARVFRCFF